LHNESFLKSISDEKKLAYFHELLRKNDEIYLQFENFFKLQNDVKESIGANDLERLITEIFDNFESIDTEEWMENHACGCNRSYYDFEESAYEDILEEIFEKYETQIIAHATNSQLYEALFICMAIYKALLKDPSIKDDNYCLFGDSFLYNALDYLKVIIINNLSEKIHTLVLSQEEIQRSISFLIESVEEEKSLSIFSSFFQNIISTVEIATFTKQFIDKLPPLIQLDILNLLHEDSEYIQTAELYYLDDSLIAELLLTKIHQLSDYKSYEKIAVKVFEKYPEQFARKILNVITYTQTPVLYLKALKMRCVKESSINDYHELKNYFTDNELLDFQNYIGNLSYKKFYIAILEDENRYAEILTLAQKNLKESSIDAMVYYLNPIKEIYSHEVLAIIIEHCNKALMAHGRGRGTYHTMTAWLKIIQNVQPVQVELKEYISKALYNHQPRLPALRDELQRGGFLG
jgi:hypothetical protein